MNTAKTRMIKALVLGFCMVFGFANFAHAVKHGVKLLPVPRILREIAQYSEGNKFSVDEWVIVSRESLKNRRCFGIVNKCLETENVYWVVFADDTVERYGSASLGKIQLSGVELDPAEFIISDKDANEAQCFSKEFFEETRSKYGIEYLCEDGELVLARHPDYEDEAVEAHVYRTDNKYAYIALFEDGCVRPISLSDIAKLKFKKWYAEVRSTKRDLMTLQESSEAEWNSAHPSIPVTKGDTVSVLVKGERYRRGRVLEWRGDSPTGKTLFLVDLGINLYGYKEQRVYPVDCLRVIRGLKLS